MVTGIHSLTQTDYIYYSEGYSEELIRLIICETKNILIYKMLGVIIYVL
jgi:hypothetical protein